MSPQASVSIRLDLLDQRRVRFCAEFGETSACASNRSRALASRRAAVLIRAATVLLVMPIAHRSQLPRRLARNAFFTAGYHYMRYFIQFPILIFLTAIFFEVRQVTMLVALLAVCVAIYAVVNLLAYRFYSGFEAHTAKAQRAIFAAITRPRLERPYG